MREKELPWWRSGGHAPNAAGPGLIPGQGTRSHMRATIRVHKPQLRSLRAATKEPASGN